MGLPHLRGGRLRSRLGEFSLLYHTIPKNGRMHKKRAKGKRGLS